MKRKISKTDLAIGACAMAIFVAIAALIGVIFAQPGEEVVQVDSYSWYFLPREDGKQPEPTDQAPFYKNYNAYYVGDAEEKVIYLTFDAGYENGYTEKILDILKENEIPAAFFLDGHYLDANQEIVKRMVKEGHLVCNHTAGHKDLSNVSYEEFEKQLVENEKAFREITGEEMPKYFRPPAGTFSETTLQYADKMGYKTIFWSFAYKDWVEGEQPNPSSAVKKIISRTHPGEIALLHSTSETNAQILEEVIKQWKEMGYTFKSLDELPEREAQDSPAQETQTAA